MMLSQTIQSNLEIIAHKIQPIAKQCIIPKSLSKLTIKLPFEFNAFIIESVVNKILSSQIQEGDFNFLDNKRFQLAITDAEINLGLSYKNNKIVCIHYAPSTFKADVTLSINTSDAISLIKQEIDPDTLFFQRKLKIQGDTELAHHIKNTIDTLDPKVIPEMIVKLLTQYKKRIL